MTTSTHIEHPLVDRVLHAVPARAYEMQALLGLLRIEASDAVPTAAVTCQYRPVLLINPGFVERHCRTDEHLFMLVMHELHHVLLGHTRLFPRPTPAHNVAFDAVINASLCARFPAQAYTSFFLDFYGQQGGVTRLLAPPASPPNAIAGKLGSLHRALYGDGQVTAREVFDAIVRALAGAPMPMDPAVPLLGSHDSKDGSGIGQSTDRDVVEALENVADNWPAPDPSNSGRGLGGLLVRVPIDPAARLARDVLQAVKRALLAAARPTGHKTQRETAHVPASLVLPSARDRRAHVWRAAGLTPLLYDQTITSPRAREATATEIYFDVSGSMAPYLSPLVAAFNAHRRLLAPEVRLFSTQVVTVSLEALSKGRLDSTGGTDITPVFEDIVRRAPRRVLIVTDGIVGRADDALQRRLTASAAELRVLLTPGGRRGDLEGLVHWMGELPAITGGRK